MKKIYLALLIILLTTNVFAASEQVPLNRTITSIRAYDSFVFITFAPEFAFNQECPPDGRNDLVVINTSNELGKNIYSAALTAASANKQVGFGVEGCHINRHKTYRIDVKF